MAYTAKERLFVTEDHGKVVPEGHPDARYLLVAKGGQLTDEDAKKYGLHGGAPESKAVEHAPENKAVDGPHVTKTPAAPPARVQSK